MRTTGTHPRSIRPLLRTVALLLAPLALTTCQAKSAEECAGVSFSSDALVQAKIRAFVDTSAALAVAADRVEQDTLGACRDMASKLGIPAAELTPPDPTLPNAEVRTVCTRVKTEIDALLKANLPSQAKLTIVYTPSVCTIDSEVQRTCIQTCEMKEVKETELQCSPAMVVGTCSATCMGTCTGSCGGMCMGSCSATCNGQCSGNCKGVCEGTCTLKNAAGECIGQCMGTCKGSCDATCSGTCSGKCTGSCSLTCMGDCRGGCSVAYTAPRCEEIVTTRQVTECTKTCDTKARLEARCTEPELLVDFYSDVTPEKQAKLKTLVTALRSGLPKLLKVTVFAGQAFQRSVADYKAALDGLSSAVAASGKTAVECVLGAAQSTGRAVGQVSVSVEVSVMVSASAQATVN